MRAYDQSGPRGGHHQLWGLMLKSVRGAISATLIGTVIVLTGCSAEPKADRPDVASASQAPIKVDEGLVTVDVTIARSLLDANGSMTDEAIVAAAKEKGFTATVNHDAVIYTMTKRQRDEMLSQMRSSAQEAVDKMVT